MGTIIVKMDTILYSVRTKTSSGAHKHIKNMFTKGLDRERWKPSPHRFLFNQISFYYHKAPTCLTHWMHVEGTLPLASLSRPGSYVLILYMSVIWCQTYDPPCNHLTMHPFAIRNPFDHVPVFSTMSLRLCPLRSVFWSAIINN